MTEFDMAEVLQIQVRGVALWQIAAVLGLVLAGWLVARFMAPLLSRLLRGGAKGTETAWDDRVAETLVVPLRLGVWAAVVFLAMPVVGFSGTAQELVGVAWRLVAVLILGAVLSGWVSVGGDLLARAVSARDDEVIRGFVPIFVRSARVLVWAVVIVVALEVVGVEVMGLVAGLGIGGLAVAFAAKDTIANLFGSFAIASDRPFVVGDYIKVGPVAGTVEEIGLRSTRLRTSQRSLVSMPNGDLMNQRIENISRRDRIQFNPSLRLESGASSAQVLLVIDDLKKLLLGHPEVFRDVVRVRLAGLVEGSAEIQVTAWIETTDSHRSSAVAEELLLATLDIVEAAGVRLAAPSRRLIEDSGDDVGGEAQRAAEAVTERRRDGVLWIPEPPAGDSA